MSPQRAESCVDVSWHIQLVYLLENSAQEDRLRLPGKSFHVLHVFTFDITYSIPLDCPQLAYDTVSELCFVVSCNYLIVEINTRRSFVPHTSFTIHPQAQMWVWSHGNGGIAGHFWGLYNWTASIQLRSSLDLIAESCGDVFVGVGRFWCLARCREVNASGMLARKMYFKDLSTV